MKKTLAILSLVFLFSCQKGSDSPDNNPTTNCKLTKVQYLRSQMPLEYTVVYAGNNISELVSSADKVVFTYDASGNIIKKDWFITGNTQVQWRIEYSFNTQNQLTGQASYEFNNGTLEPTNRYEFGYTENNISEMRIYNMPSDTYNGKEVLTWSNGNPVTLTIYNDAGTVECVNNLTFDLTKENKFNSQNKKFFQQDLYDDDFDNVRFLSKNVLTKISSQCPDLEEDVFTYTYDANGYIKEIFQQGEPDALWKFTYSCN